MNDDQKRTNGHDYRPPADLGRRLAGVQARRDAAPPMEPVIPDGIALGLARHVPPRIVISLPDAGRMSEEPGDEPDALPPHDPAERTTMHVFNAGRCLSLGCDAVPPAPPPTVPSEGAP